MGAQGSGLGSLGSSCSKGLACLHPPPTSLCLPHGLQMVGWGWTSGAGGMSPNCHGPVGSRHEAWPCRTESEGLLMSGVSTGLRGPFAPKPGFSLQSGLAREAGVLGARFRRKGEKAIATCLPSGSEARTHAAG